MSSTSTSSSPLPDPDGDSAITDGKSPAVRRSTRKRGSGAGSRDASARAASTSAPTNDIAMLEQWIRHDNHSYHLDFLSPKQAYKIRIALVEWYRANRRKLPWRGDAGPYDGSTAGFAATAAGNSGGKKTNGKKRKDEGKDIRSFFDASSTKKKKKSGKSKTPIKQTSTEEKVDSNNDGMEMVTTEPREVTAYGVWVSEIMLQQTRVEAVIPYYLKWMKSFPTVYCLANATEEEVNSHWAGLGFYRRARLLHAGAKRVVKDYDGIVPNTVEELMKLEGIGRYTASAVASIAHGVEVPVVDGNVCRVLSRLTGIANHIKAPVMKDDLGWTLAEKLIEAKSSGDNKTDSKSSQAIGSPGEVNQAMMELGATYCSPAGSGIDDGDPLKEFYVTTQLGVALGQATHSGSSSVRSNVESLIAKRALAAEEGKGNQCRLCDPNGISTAYYNIMDRMATDLSTDSKTNAKTVYAIAGHASLPIPPPKKSKREEVIAVAVIGSQTSGNDRCWLMIKRPPKGLLAGQWEFPSVCVWNSAKDGEKKEKGKKPSIVEVPLIDPDVRSDALDSFLCTIFESNDASPSMERVQVKDAPVVHIFSHVCHTMWVEYGGFGDSSDEFQKADKWKLDNGQEIGWMTEEDMASVGITSGVRKVLATVQQSKKSAS